MAAVIVGCHKNNPHDSRHCLLPYKKVLKTFICMNYTYFCKKKNMFFCMTTNSDGCHVGYLYDNRQWRLPWSFQGAIRSFVKPILFTPTLYYCNYIHAELFKMAKTHFKLVKNLVLKYYLRDIFCLQMYALVTLAHMDNLLKENLLYNFLLLNVILKKSRFNVEYLLT